jgi:hypothetical protein
MNGYFLFGTNEEVILVLKSGQEEDILNIIKKLATMRSKEMKAFASQLEESFYERSYRNNVQTGPKNKTEGSNSNGGRNSKTKNPKHRAQHGSKGGSRSWKTDPNLGE